MKEKIPTANYPKRVTIFTANFWKLIAIRGALIQGLSWLLKYQISKCRMWRLFDFSFSKRFFFMLKLVIAACRVEYDKYFMSPSYFTIYFRTIRHLGTWVKYSAEYEKWIKYLPILHNADLLQYAKKQMAILYNIRNNPHPINFKCIQGNFSHWWTYESNYHLFLSTRITKTFWLRLRNYLSKKKYLHTYDKNYLVMRRITW